MRDTRVVNSVFHLPVPAFDATAQSFALSLLCAEFFMAMRFRAVDDDTYDALCVAVNGDPLEISHTVQEHYATVLGIICDA